MQPFASNFFILIIGVWTLAGIAGIWAGATPPGGGAASSDGRLPDDNAGLEEGQLSAEDEEEEVEFLGELAPVVHYDLDPAHGDDQESQQSPVMKMEAEAFFGEGPSTWHDPPSYEELHDLVCLPYLLLFL